MMYITKFFDRSAKKRDLSYNEKYSKRGSIEEA